MPLLRWSGFTLPLVVSFVVACGGTSNSPDDSNVPDSPSPDSSSSTDDGSSSQPPPNDGSDGGSQQPVTKVATVRVHYPAGAKSLVLKGDQPPLSAAGTPLKDVSNDTWELSLGEIEAPVSFTPVLDGKDARGPAYSVSPGQTLDIYPHFEATAGTVKLLPGFKSNVLNNQRDLRIYLPPSYEENTVARYPVVYMHDGQVIFDKDLASLDGAAKNFFGSWKAEKHLDEGVEKGTLPEVIIVGVDIIIKFDPNPLNLLANLTEIREQELTPTKDESFRKGSGKGPDYLRMIIEEIKPKIDADYRTLTDREHTFMAGSSLGGLMSIWAGIDHGDVFGGILAMSSSAWWDDEVASKRITAENGGPKRTLKAYTDTGDKEAGKTPPLGATQEQLDAANLKQVEQTERLWKAYRDVGYVDDQTLKAVVAAGAEHKGQYWSERFPAALQFIVGSGR